MSTADIRDLAMQLPPDERTVLAHNLLASVEPGASTGHMPSGAAKGVVEQVVALTAQLFPGMVTVKESYDPEYPGETYRVFVAETSDDPVTILNLENQWNRQVTQHFPGWHGFRLSVRRKRQVRGVTDS